MNDCLRWSMNVKNLLPLRYDKAPAKTNSESCRKQRNIVTGNRKKSTRKCIEQNYSGNKSRQFWEAVKPRFPISVNKVTVLSC